MNSCIYTGWVRHRRFVPIRHEFRYRLAMMYLDLAELPTLFSGRWLWSAKRPALARFRREDHLGPAEVPLDRAVRDLVEGESGERPEGPIRLLTHPRYFGYCFNPVSFYFVGDRSDGRVETIVAEVSNTPWREMHCYVLPERMNLMRGGAKKRFRFAKNFHVSPFMGMDHVYDWRFTQPGAALSVHMDNLRQGVRVFDATMTLRREEISARGLTTLLVRYPFMTGKVIGAIYFEALRLRLKGAPAFAHPATLAGQKEATGS